MSDSWRERVSRVPRLGWVTSPSPVQEIDAQSRLKPLGVGRLFFKRDDQLGADFGLLGGTKIRKLDVLLAAQPWRDAPLWTSVGAIGSGQLVALSAAARLLGRSVRSHLFWEPVLPELLWNLAYVASGPGELTYSGGRVALALKHPGVLLSQRSDGAVVVPPGATTTLGEVGMLGGVVELLDQIATGVCPTPDHVFVPVGSGGTLVGLWLGLALAGVPCTVHGVTTVERAYATECQLRARARRLVDFLGLPAVTLPPLRLHREALGAGYGVSTPASRAACEDFQAAGIGLEPIYSGKAMDGLRRAAAGLSGADIGHKSGPNVLFWLTPRRPGPLPAAEDWRDRLPAALQKRLAADERPGSTSPTRRRVLLAVGGAVAAVTVGRHLGAPEPPSGVETLPDWAAFVLRAACEAVIVPTPDADALDDLVRRIDTFVATQPLSIRLQILGALELVEQMTLPLAGRLLRFTSLDVEGRRGVLTSLAARGGLVAEAGRAARDLAVLGHYQRDTSWPALGYGGPWVSRTPRPDPYAALATDAPPPGFEALP